MQPSATLTIAGALEGAPVELRFADLAALPAAEQVADVAALVPGRRGTAVRLAALLRRARPRPEATWIGIGSRDPGFAVSVALAEVAGALVVYALDGAPLAREQGGPFRLLVPGHPDECVHVKDVAALEVRTTRGRDTRPVDDAEHARLHAKKR
jgi:DMSO/TMAO reductase YedYZ molybdopterin-dependent catalytic subunit